MSPPTTASEPLAAIFSRLFVARRAELVERLSQPGTPAMGQALPSSTQLLAYLFEAAGLRGRASVSRRTFQRQKAGQPTANTSDRVEHALVRLFVDALEVENAAHIELEKLRTPVREELGSLASSWDRLAHAVADAADDHATRHAVLRLAMVELTVRRAAMLRALGATRFEPWFATAAHPIDRAIQLALGSHRISLDALRRELVTRGIARRTFESWRHERQIPPVGKLDVIAKAIADLAKLPPRARRRGQIAAMLRCARVAKLARRDLVRALGADGEHVVQDAYGGHDRLSEVVFDVLGDEEALKLAVALGILARPTSDWAENLRAASSFDREARRLVDDDQGWFARLVGPEDPAAPALEQLSRLPLEGRLDAFRVLLVQSLADPEISASVYPQLRVAALHDVVAHGPRAPAFQLLLRRVTALVPSGALRDDLHALTSEPMHRVLELVARADVLAFCRQIAREHGRDASHVEGLERQMLLFEAEPAS